METPSTRANGLPKRSRLVTPASFGEVLSYRGNGSFRRTCGRIALAARISDTRAGCRPAVRFGFTVGKTNARRAVDRVLVKRVMRESARAGKPLLEAGGVTADVVLRLRSGFSGKDLRGGLGEVKSGLRRDCDSLMAQLLKRAAP